MQDMSRGGVQRGASVLPLQMQWQYQIRPSELPHGMAIAFSEKALRVVQDPVPLHKALLSTNAKHGAFAGLPTSSCLTGLQKLADLVTVPARRVCLGGLATLVDAVNLEGAFLVWRWWLGGLARGGETGHLSSASAIGQTGR